MEELVRRVPTPDIPSRGPVASSRQVAAVHHSRHDMQKVDPGTWCSSKAGTSTAVVRPTVDPGLAGD
jgi:hypothetical protein